MVYRVPGVAAVFRALSRVPSCGVMVGSSGGLAGHYRQGAMTLRAIDAAPGGKAAARLELLCRAAARAGPAKLDQPAILARALDRHDDSRHHKSRHQDEVRDRDEQAAQRKGPNIPSPASVRPSRCAGVCSMTTAVTREGGWPNAVSEA